MLKRNSKLLAIVMVFALCMTCIAPVFAPAAAQASDMYSVIKAPTVSPLTSGTGQNIGSVIKVTIPDTSIAAGSLLTVSMPSDWKFKNGATNAAYPAANVVAASTGNQVEVLASYAKATTDDGVALDTAAFAAGSFTITPNNTFDIKMAAVMPATDVGTDRFFYIYFNGIDMQNATGDQQVSMIGPSGSAFDTALNLVVAKSSRSGSTVTSIKKVNEISGNDTLDILTVMEASANTLDSAGTIKLKILTKGFTFDNSGATLGAVSYGWDFAGLAALPLATLSSDQKEIAYPLVAANMGTRTSPGKVSFINLPIAVDDTVVEAGDTCQIQVSGADMTKTTVDVATFGSFGLSIAAGTQNTLIAGVDDQEVGTFNIKEEAAGSWVAGRTVTLALPSGAAWRTLGDINVTNSSDLGSINDAISGTDNQYLKFTVPAGSVSTSGGAAIELKDYSVDLSPEFSGDLTATVSGTAGLTGEVKLATVVPAATITVSELKDVVLGMADQKLGDITLTEGDAEGFQNTTAGGGNEIRLILDDGYRWTKAPTIAVTEGNLDLSSSVTINDETLTIKVKSQSSKASKILISDVYVDAYRTAPQGSVNIHLDKGTSAVTTAAVAALFPNDYPAKVQIANCVTPAPSEGTAGSATAQFKISSNIYSVNGVAKVMDAAPYIKAGRTYVPVRYLGLALGVADSDVVWDATAQTATLTLGDKVIVLTIGSTTYTVNGEAKTMDVAPEINNGRTMLPARYVAEGLGYVVGWDASTGTVLVSK